MPTSLTKDQRTGIFRRDDPVLELRLAPNHAVQLRRLLDQLPAELFCTDDALGWTYQFWQAKRKNRINKSGVKIGADELPAVTQLFTEDYMVEFLLHNAIGAWWAGRCASVNIRPFLLAKDIGKKGAGILRTKPNIKWDKDRGKEPHRDKADYPWFWRFDEPPLSCPGGADFTGNRWNNVHLTLACKRAARNNGG